MNKWTPTSTPPAVPEGKQGVRVLCCWTKPYTPEVLVYWKDGVWADTCEFQIDPDELPDYWMALPEAPETNHD